jgi:hypothetical protein
MSRCGRGEFVVGGELVEVGGIVRLRCTQEPRAVRVGRALLVAGLGSKRHAITQGESVARLPTATNVCVASFK